jgi:hypothetical protein
LLLELGVDWSLVVPVDVPVVPVFGLLPVSRLREPLAEPVFPVLLLGLVAVFMLAPELVLVP